MFRTTISPTADVGRVVWVYETRGCGNVTPEEFRHLLQRLEQQRGRRITAKSIPWELEVIGEFALEVFADADDDHSPDLGDPSRWGYCDHCGERGGNAGTDAEGGLVFVCQRCETVFADPWDDDQPLYG